MLSGKALKFDITFVLCMFPDSASYSVSRVLRDCCQSKSESGLLFCRGGLFGVLVCCLCSMDEMLIRFSLVFDKWMTTPTPPSEPMDGSVRMGCTTPAFPPCSEMSCTALATWGVPRTMVTHTVSSGMDAARSTWTSRLTPLTRA
jgi:hypothetical protein